MDEIIESIAAEAPVQEQTVIPPEAAGEQDRGSDEAAPAVKQESAEAAASDASVESPEAVVPAAPPSECLGPPEWAAAIERDLRAAIDASVGEILGVFEQKLAYDRFKDEQISKLHAELQTYKAGLLEKMTRPYVMGFIRMHDDIAKVAQDVLKRAETYSAEKAAGLLTGFQEDIEIFLEQQGVSVYRETGEKFNPKRQTALATVPTSDPAQVGMIAAALRPGFEQDALTIQKERVSVYVLDDKAREQTVTPVAENGDPASPVGI